MWGSRRSTTIERCATGAPEAIFCPGKTPEQVVTIARRLAAEHVNVLATRAEAPTVAAVAAAGLPHVYHADARLLIVRPAPTEGLGLIVVAAAGTSDLPVAEEAALVAEVLGNRVERIVRLWRGGAAPSARPLRHACSSQRDRCRGRHGGRLAERVAGLVDRPVIAVPTSVGYGASLGGLAALLAMLNSCAPGVSVVNIDNGYGAAHQASQINHLRAGKAA